MTFNGPRTLREFSDGAASFLSGLAANKDAYAQKKAECKQEAKGKHFGIRFIKRDHWIKNCIAGSHAC